MHCDQFDTACEGVITLLLGECFYKVSYNLPISMVGIAIQFIVNIVSHNFTLEQLACS